MGGLFGGSLRKTSNSGTVWSGVADFGGDLHLWDFQFLDANTGWICADVTGRFVGNSIIDMEGSIWKTTDGGETWTLQYGWPQEFESFSSYSPNTPVVGPDFDDVSFPSEKVGFALGHRVFSGIQSFLYKTDNGGASWTRFGEVPLLFHRIEFPNEWHGFGLSEDGEQPIFETVNGGQTWFPRHDVGEAGTLSATASVNNIGFTGLWSDMFFADDLHGWIVRDQGTFSGDKRNVLRTSDAGKTWQSSDLPLQPDAHRIFFSDPMNGWLASAYGTIEGTVDGGKIWNIQIPLMDPFPEFRTVYFIDEDTGVAGGSKGIIADSTSGGDVWHETLPDLSRNFSGASFITCLRTRHEIT